MIFIQIINFPLRITQSWIDERIIMGDLNKHRDTECPGNDIEDWERFRPPALQILHSKTKVFGMLGQMEFCTTSPSGFSPVYYSVQISPLFSTVETLKHNFSVEETDLHTSDLNMLCNML